VNIDWAIGQLDTFIDMTRSRNGSNNAFITSQSFAVTPRDQVIAQQAVVVRILDSRTPDWREEHPVRETYEFGQVRDAAISALAGLRREGEITANLEPPAPALSADSLHRWVWEPARPLWRDGHYRAAVQTAATGLDTRLQDFAGRGDIFGTNLVHQCLTDDAPRPGKPRLRVPDQGNERTTQSVQEGLRALGAAAFQLARNPASHRVDDISEQEALEMMAVLSLFARTVETCTVATADES
jgi:uncharacterized protein (TIGR02391 family)